MIPIDILYIYYIITYMAKINKTLLKELCGDCTKDYCFLQELVLNDAKYSSRLITQMKLIEIYKWEQSQITRTELTWSETMAKWADSGLAAKFAEVYKEDLSYKEIQTLLGL